MEMEWLPAGAVKIEYLQSSGTQYIITNTINTKNTELYLDFQLTDSINEDRKIIGQGYKFGLGTTSSVWRTIGSTWFATSLATDTNRHIFTTDTGKFFIDNTQIADKYSYKEAGTYSMLIFAASQENSISLEGQCAKMKLYRCKIYENRTLIKDFIPVRIEQTGYLYDKVSRQLYGNSGSGNFVLGPDIV